jgi:hypothetical protein
MEQISSQEQEKKLDLLKAGDTVKVLRSNGTVEDGWTIGNFDQETGDIVVQKKGADKGGKSEVLQKIIPQIELYALNKPGGETRKFSVKEWLRLWEETEWRAPNYQIGELDIPSEEQDELLTPQEARIYIAKLVQERIKRIGGVKNAGDLQKEKQRNAIFGIS